MRIRDACTQRCYAASRCERCDILSPIKTCLSLRLLLLNVCLREKFFRLLSLLLLLLLFPLYFIHWQKNTRCAYMKAVYWLHTAAADANATVLRFDFVLFYVVVRPSVYAFYKHCACVWMYSRWFVNIKWCFACMWNHVFTFGCSILLTRCWCC